MLDRTSRAAKKGSGLEIAEVRQVGMETFQAAHLNIHGVNVVVVFLETGFDSETADRRRDLYTVLRDHATRAGLAGEIVIVWQDASGRTRFIAPAQQHAFFRILSYEQLYAQINQTLIVPGS